MRTASIVRAMLSPRRSPSSRKSAIALAHNARRQARRVVAHAGGHRQQVDRRGDARPVVKALEDRQGLLVMLESRRLLDIRCQFDPVQAVAEWPVAELVGQGEALEVVAGPMRSRATTRGVEIDQRSVTAVVFVAAATAASSRSAAALRLEIAQIPRASAHRRRSWPAVAQLRSSPPRGHSARTGSVRVMMASACSACRGIGLRRLPRAGGVEVVGQVGARLANDSAWARSSASAMAWCSAAPRQGRPRSPGGLCVAEGEMAGRFLDDPACWRPFPQPAPAYYQAFARRARIEVEASTSAIAASAAPGAAGPAGPPAAGQVRAGRRCWRCRTTASGPPAARRGRCRRRDQRAQRFLDEERLRRSPATTPANRDGRLLEAEDRAQILDLAVREAVQRIARPPTAAVEAPGGPGAPDLVAPIREHEQHRPPASRAAKEAGNRLASPACGGLRRQQRRPSAASA